MSMKTVEGAAARPYRGRYSGPAMLPCQVLVTSTTSRKPAPWRAAERLPMNEASLPGSRASPCALASLSKPRPAQPFARTSSCSSDHFQGYSDGQQTNREMRCQNTTADAIEPGRAQ